MTEIADLHITLPVEVEYEIRDDSIEAHRVFVSSRGQRVDVTHHVTDDDWHDIMHALSSEYMR